MTLSLGGAFGLADIAHTGRPGRPCGLRSVAPRVHVSLSGSASPLRLALLAER